MKPHRFRLGDQFRKRNFQSLRNRIGRVQAGVAHSALNHANVGLMQPRFLGEFLLAQLFCCPVLFLDQRKSI